jgi:pimeloyl-ACP methyl ester carboxylesterase
MSKWARRLFMAVGLTFSVFAISGAAYQWVETRRELAATPPPGRLVDIGGHRLHIWCSGSGVPAVILETGLGGTSAGWGFVQPETAKFTQVCSYDRAGMGYSDPGPAPRTSRQIARELAVLLQRSRLTAPVILVGASIGGLNVRLFASEYAERVAGLVLVDATHEDQLDPVPGLARFVPLLSSTGVLRLLGVSFELDAETLAPAVRPFARATRYWAAGYNAAADEIIHGPISAAEAKAARRKLAVPLIVITGGRGSDATWRKLQRDQVSLSSLGCLVTAPQSGHLIAVEQPTVVVDAIRAVVGAARSGKSFECPPQGVSGLDFHDLRHEAGSRMLESGWPLHHVQRMLDHADVKQTATYLNAERVAVTIR